MESKKQSNKGTVCISFRTLSWYWYCATPEIEDDSGKDDDDHCLQIII